MPDQSSRKTRPQPTTWVENALRAMEGRLRDERSRVTGEEVRSWLRARRFRCAPHHNAYGALIRTAVRRGLLRPLREFRPARAATSRGRITPVYAVNKTQHLRDRRAGASA